MKLKKLKSQLLDLFIWLICLTFSYVPAVVLSLMVGKFLPDSILGHAFHFITSVSLGFAAGCLTVTLSTWLNPPSNQKTDEAP